MYVLNIDLLQLGDIILSRSAEPLSAFVRRQSNSNYSHAALVVADNSCVESTGDGVHAETLQRLGFETENDALVLRLQTPASIADLDTSMNFARTKVGTDYASRSEVTRSYSGSATYAQEQNRQYCTRLVAQAYAAAGIALVANADYCTPGDIEQSALLKVVPNCLVEANKEQEEWVREAERGESITITQASITSNFLEQVQQLTDLDLQTLEQVDSYLAADQTYDSQIAELLTQSGYLGIGDEEKRSNPWFYDLAEFEKQGNEQHRYDFAQGQEFSEAVRSHAYSKAAQAYQQQAQALQSSYFTVMANCAARQYELSQERMKVWQATIASYLPF